MVQRKTTNDNSGCCDPISDLQLEIDQVNAVATEAKTTANTASGRVDGLNSNVNELKGMINGWDVKIDTNTANIATLQTEIDEVDVKADTNATAISTLDSNVVTLKGKVSTLENNGTINRQNIATNTSAISVINGKLTTDEAEIDQLQEDSTSHSADLENLKPRVAANEDKIAALTPRVTTCEDAIDTLESEIGNEATNDTIRYRLGQLETKVPTAIKEVTVTQDASTVYHNATKISGVVEKDALPVASRTQAGVMSASIYGSFEDQINNNSDRIAVLEQIGTTYDISGLVSSDPTDDQITAAFNSKYPTITITAGMRVADYNNAHFWQYGNNQWIILTQIVVNKASNTSLGTVKGEESALGKVFVESDGSMSLNGYDALVSKDTTHDNKIAALETWEAAAKSQIEGLGATDTTLDGKISALAARVTTAEGDIDTCESDIDKLETRCGTIEGNVSALQTWKTTASGQISALQNKDTTIEGNVSALATRVSTAEGAIDTCEADIDSLEGRMSTAETNITSVSTKATTNTTAINECASSISSLSTRVTSVEGKTSWKTSSKSLSDLLTITTSSITINEEFRIVWLMKNYRYMGVTDFPQISLTLDPNNFFGVYCLSLPVTQGSGLYAAVLTIQFTSTTEAITNIYVNLNSQNATRVTQLNCASGSDSQYIIQTH